MDRRIRATAIALAACAVAGCQTAPPPAPPPAPQVSMAPMTQPARAPSGQPAPPANNPKAEIAAKLAEQQAASIDALLAARAAADRGVTVVEPSHTPPPPAAPPPAAPATDLRPVPPLNGVAPPDVAAPAAVPPPAAPGVAPAAPDPVRPAAPPVAPPPAADPLGPRLAKHAAEVPRDLAAQLDAQLYQFAADNPVPTPEALAGLSGEDKSILGSVLDGLSNFRTNVRNDSNLLIGDKIRPLLDMADRLRGQADLRVTNLTLCRSAPAFGMYDPIVPPQLVSGAPPQAFYYEIENFNPRLDEKGMYVTALDRVIVLYDQAGKVAWAMPKAQLKDVCHVRRHDFFDAGRLRLGQLPAGKYLLKVTLNDPVAQRVAELGLTITIVAPAAAAPAPPRPAAVPIAPPLFDR